MVKVSTFMVLMVLMMRSAIAQEAATVDLATDPQPKASEAWWVQRHQAKVAERKERKEIDLLFIGDSITHGWENGGKATWDAYYGKRRALNLGFSGDRTENVLWRLQHGEVDDMAPKVAVIMIGTNNAGHRDEPSEQTAAGVRAIVNELQNRLPKTRILLLAVFPRGENSDDGKRKLNDGTNKIIQSFADNRKVWFLDINSAFLERDGTLPKTVMPDLLHPNVKGYEIWARSMEPQLVELLEMK